MSEPIVIPIDKLAMHVDAEPGTKIVFHGAYHSSFDGADIDAATTTWPEGAPGGASVDPGGLLDLAGGGFHLLARDTTTHEVTVIATGKAAPACAAAGVASPCLVMRTLAAAQSRLMTVDDWTHSLDGRVTAEILVPPPPPAYAAVTESAATPWVVGGLALAVAIGAGLGFRARRKRSPLYAMRMTLRRLEGKLEAADAALSAALGPALARVRKVIEGKKIDPRSSEGTRISEVLRRVEARLDDTFHQGRAAREQAAADELVIEMESALEAAHEVMSTSRA